MNRINCAVSLLLIITALLPGVAPANAQKAKTYPPRTKPAARPAVTKKSLAPPTPPRNVMVPLPASLAYLPHWSPKTLGSIYGLQVGMTRADVLRLYLPDSGITTRTQGRFIYKSHPSFGSKGVVLKINVGFAPANGVGIGSVALRGSGGPYADDVITFISDRILSG